MLKRESCVVLAIGAASVLGGCRSCSKSESQEAAKGDAADSRPLAGGAVSARAFDLGLPITAAHSGNGSVIVAGFDAVSKNVRVIRIDASDRVVDDHTVSGDDSGFSVGELRINAHDTEGAFLTWRGMRGEKPVGWLVRLGPTLAPVGETIPVPISSCATRDAIWFTDGAEATSRSFSGAKSTVVLPKDSDSGLLCGNDRAYALLGDEDRSAILPLGSGGTPLDVYRDKDFSDEEREVAEYTVGEDVGFVRVGASGALALRELRAGTLGPIRKLKTSIGKDDDLVGVDASPEFLSVVYARDASANCPAAENAEAPVATKLLALRVRRDTFEESTVEIATGKCGVDMGPLFSGAVGKSISLAWLEGAAAAGKARAPIVGLAHTKLGPNGAANVERFERNFDAIIDAGCDATRCYAVALSAREADAGAATVSVLRY
jgi:hypothetical protein